MPKAHRSNLKSGENAVTLEEKIPSSDVSPLDKVIKLHHYQGLSNESKFVVKIILNTPKEFFHLISTETGMITKNSIQAYLENKWPGFIVNYVMKELKSWVKTF